MQAGSPCVLHPASRRLLERRRLEEGEAQTWVWRARWVVISLINPAESARVNYRGKTELSKMPAGSKLNRETEAKSTQTEPIWLDIAIKRSNFASEEEDLQSEESPKNNFSENEEKLEQPNGDNWLNEGRVAE